MVTVCVNVTYLSCLAALLPHVQLRQHIGTYVCTHHHHRDEFTLLLYQAISILCHLVNGHTCNSELRKSNHVAPSSLPTDTISAVHFQSSKKAQFLLASLCTLRLRCNLGQSKELL